ncbi:hypothetical protein M1563_00640 [Patescibacteria group bacterium]|nr:hypothetical protein [Patescibacteria group bacterium]MCL5410125.1 hypothetical protein [Patescibacteria group bacterium]
MFRDGETRGLDSNALNEQFALLSEKASEVSTTVALPILEATYKPSVDLVQALRHSYPNLSTWWKEYGLNSVQPLEQSRVFGWVLLTQSINRLNGISEITAMLKLEVDTRGDFWVADRKLPIARVIDSSALPPFIHRLEGVEDMAGYPYLRTVDYRHSDWGVKLDLPGVNGLDISHRLGLGNMRLHAINGYHNGFHHNGNGYH